MFGSDSSAKSPTLLDSCGRWVFVADFQVGEMYVPDHKAIPNANTPPNNIHNATHPYRMGFAADNEVPNACWVCF